MWTHHTWSLILKCSTMAGEDAQNKGRDGVDEAKRWLEKSTRVVQAWTNEDEGLSEMLAFKWPHGNEFSFDLGGRFRGGDIDGHMFISEVKKYSYESNLPAHYKSFLAKCYVAITEKPNRCRHFLWISWSPFQAKRWNLHTSVATVKDAVLEEKGRIFGVDDDSEALSKLDISAVADVSNRIWLITLCNQQLQLVLTREHYGEIARLMKISEES